MSRLPLRGHLEAQRLLNGPSNGDICRHMGRLTLARVVLAYIDLGELDEAKRVLKQAISEANACLDQQTLEERK
jgi:Tfp pilus assembly ATPase PilU